MVGRSSIGFVVALALLTWNPLALRAQQATHSMPYTAGWNMIGLPPGTGLASAHALYVYGPHGYTLATGPNALGCVGEWAFFSSPTRITLNANAPEGPTQTCPLQAGWNMVANPFAADALLPDGTVAYDWDPIAGRYDLVSVIPVGQAVWVHADAASSLSLVNSAMLPVAGPPPPIPDPGPVHVGETFRVILPNDLIRNISISAPYTALFDSSRLRLEGPGVTSTERYWTFLALTAGDTEVNIEPACRLATPPCIHGTELGILVTVQP